GPCSTVSVPRAAGRTPRTSTCSSPRCRCVLSFWQQSCAAPACSPNLPSSHSRGEVHMAQQGDDRVMISERLAPGMLPRVLNTTDMTIIFLAIVLFIVQASVIQPAGPSAYVYWILGFLLFLIPGAIITAQLGQMFPQEGSLYVWTQKALGPF